jgi:hypothetical protein
MVSARSADAFEPRTLKCVTERTSFQSLQEFEFSFGWRAQSELRPNTRIQLSAIVKRSSQTLCDLKVDAKYILIAFFFEDYAMGMFRTWAETIAAYCKELGVSGSIVQIGRQEMFFGVSELKDIIARTGNSPSDLVLSLECESRAVVSESKELAWITPEYYFAHLGFSRVDAVDISEYEGANVILNLNEPAKSGTPQYDFVFDSGTIEHVFHIPNYFQNIHSLCKVGGHILHLTQSSGWMGHGFYLICPTLFWDFYEVNGYRIVRAEVWQIPIDPKLNPRFFGTIKYRPGLFPETHQMGISAESYFMVMFVVQRLDSSTGDVAPIQSSYRRIHQLAREAGGHRFY